MGAPAMVSPPIYRWQLPPATDQDICATILQRRQVEPHTYLKPASLELPPATSVFRDLERAVRCLAGAIALKEPITICGDYDADGMTSTALLLLALRHVGATVNYEIPSRHHEGYGINDRIVRDCAAAGVKVIITVDNGIAAIAPIALAKDLGLSVIITDHHDLPPELPPADAILNPKQIPADSPYAGMAGVGVAYLLAMNLVERLGFAATISTALLELLTLGTIADLAQLTGINRRWVQQGLAQLPQSENLGIKALLEVTGLAQRQPLLPEAIGFGLGPRINAVGRIGEPQIVIDLLTATDPEVAHDRAAACEALNRQRQQLCQEIETAAIALVEADLESGVWHKERDRILVIRGDDWHHGVIGIVASRLLERYAVPVFIATPDAADIRGSARGIAGFDVFRALEFCADLFRKFGGHPAAGGFSLASDRWPELVERLRTYARQSLTPTDLVPRLAIDATLPLAAISHDLYADLYQMQPCGMGNPEPLLASRQVQVLSQNPFGKDKSHLKLKVCDRSNAQPREAILWRGAELMPIPTAIDIAYSLRPNHWQGQVSLDLEIKALRAAEPQIHNPAPPATTVTWHSLQADAVPEGALIYGWQRPELEGNCAYDRPQPEQTYSALVLWSWPPSQEHLEWLLATTHPVSEPLAVYAQALEVPIPSPLQLQHELSEAAWQSTTLELLRLGQQWWISPSLIVATLRSLGWTVPEFPPTPDLASAWAEQQAWYRRTV